MFDPGEWWKVAPTALHSQGKNTPFLGLELQGRTKYNTVALDADRPEEDALISLLPPGS